MPKSIFASVVLLALSPRALPAQAPNVDRAELIARFERGDEDALQALAADGDEAAQAAWEHFGGADLVARRARARLVELAGGSRSLTPALDALADPDAVVRRSLVRFLARADLGSAEIGARVERLGRVALDDSDPRVRRAAISALESLDEPRAIERLDALIGELAGAERVAAAEALGGLVHGRARARARLSTELDAPTLAALLPLVARGLADERDGAETNESRAPIVSALHHHDPLVAHAARSAYDALIARLVQLGDCDRALRVLAGFESQGIDAKLVLHQRARLALVLGGRALDALVDARALDSAAGSGLDPATLSWRARAAQLEAVAQIALGEEASARAPLARAAAILDGLLAARLDRAGKESSAVHVSWLEARALCAVTEAVRRIASVIPRAALAPPARIDPAVLDELRRAHRLMLEADLVAWRAAGDASSVVDAVLASDEGPFDLILDVPRHAAFPAARSLAVRMAFGRALASVAPREMLGFEPQVGLPPEVSDSIQDPRRRALLERAQEAQRDLIERELADLRERVWRADQDVPAGSEPRDRLELQMLGYQAREKDEAILRARTGDSKDLLDLRRPSWFVLWSARALRDEGRAKEARPYLERARADLDESALAQKFLYGLELQAEIEMALGGTWVDDGEARKAEVELSKAVDRLAALEDLMTERHGSPRLLSRLQMMRCNALVSLAVNANVKMRDPARATEWFEKAWTLRQDDFMRVLLACYRARSGRAAEARSLLRQVAPSPGTHYNMACTYALLGDKDVALEFLKRELEENQPTPGQLERQRAWARKDPDLASLHGDARYEALVKAAR